MLSQVLLQALWIGLLQAVELGAARLIWPVQVNGDVEKASQITEQIVLLSHLFELEHADLPRIDTPLLELTDQQVIELGGQFDVPWKLAWTCQFPGDKPCRVCDRCQRRKAGVRGCWTRSIPADLLAMTR